MTFLTCELRTLDGESVGVLILQPKTFKSGKAGYFATGKLELDGLRYQAQAQLVAVGTPAKQDRATQE